MVNNDSVISVGILTFVMLILSVTLFIIAVNFLQEQQELENSSIVTIENNTEQDKNIRKLDLNPSYAEVERIVEEDKSEMGEYDIDKYNCVDYSYSLVNAFLDEGIYSCITEIVFIDETAHANVVVNTSDYGLVYIEPQDDVILKEMQVGDNYCEMVNWTYCDTTWEMKHIKTCFRSFYS